MTGASEHAGAYLDVPEGDAYEQSQEEVAGGHRLLRGPIAPDVHEADALEQASELPAEDEDT